MTPFSFPFQATFLSAASFMLLWLSLDWPFKAFIDGAFFGMVISFAIDGVIHAAKKAAPSEKRHLDFEGE